MCVFERERERERERIALSNGYVEMFEKIALSLFFCGIIYFRITTFSLNKPI